MGDILKVIGIKKSYIYLFIFCLVFIIGMIFSILNKNIINTEANEDEKSCDYIKYAEFNVPYSALEKAMNIDMKTHNEDIKINWIEILAYLASKYGGEFKKYKDSDMDEVVKQLKEGKPIDELTSKMKLYNYFFEVYTAVLGEFLGDYKIQVEDKETNEMQWKEKYGLKAFSPIAKTFPFSHFDDFGVSRSYGFKRKHLGHDLMAATGTPVIAIESGTVEIMGWNQYGGWRIGIRSFDKKRYYYYAHLRQNRPYHVDLAEGKTVKAGDVIGYVGRTGYSANENVNNIDQSHLHLGLELIFNECQKECNNEIWISLYSITKLLEKNKCEITRVAETKEFYRKYDFFENSLSSFVNN